MIEDTVEQLQDDAPDRVKALESWIEPVYSALRDLRQDRAFFQAKDVARYINGETPGEEASAQAVGKPLRVMTEVGVLSEWNPETYGSARYEADFDPDDLDALYESVTGEEPPART